jgi:hypothetical protein
MMVDRIPLPSSAVAVVIVSGMRRVEGASAREDD